MLACGSVDHEAWQTNLLVQVVLLPITTQGSFAVGSVASGMVGTTVGENSPKNS